MLLTHYTHTLHALFFFARAAAFESLSAEIDTMVACWTGEYRRAPARYLLARVWATPGVGRDVHSGIAEMSPTGGCPTVTRSGCVKDAPTPDAPRHLSTPAEVYDGRCSLSELQRRNAAKAFLNSAPPMCALPLAFARGDDRALARRCRANADATHPHPKARGAGLVVALAVRAFVRDRCAPA